MKYLLVVGFIDNMDPQHHITLTFNYQGKAPKSYADKLLKSVLATNWKTHHKIVTCSPVADDYVLPNAYVTAKFNPETGDITNKRYAN